jgi:hypothetical protein
VCVIGLDGGDRLEWGERTAAGMCSGGRWRLANRAGMCGSGRGRVRLGSGKWEEQGVRTVDEDRSDVEEGERRHEV